MYIVGNWCSLIRSQRDSKGPFLDIVMREKAEIKPDFLNKIFASLPGTSISK